MCQINLGGGDDDGGSDSSDYTDWDSTPAEEQGNDGSDSADTGNQ